MLYVNHPQEVSTKYGTDGKMSEKIHLFTFKGIVV